ncbi:MAG: nucleotidyl transferase AbiEii/AbiGii toxin family protein, partial [Candidatus Omnitrophica bacterium]|nr:nucleotidyl transferase AbiEii/AbiGii toxin family protein [Candidatus Omnitrophota bacterium]
MDKNIRQAQFDVLKIFAPHSKTFALAGGTALELYYLHHRFSVDLDFFSPQYSFKEIDMLVCAFKGYARKIKMEAEFVASSHARVRFYSIPVKKTSRVLKVDFVEDVLFEKPTVEKFDNVPVYSAKNIYRQKISAITGTRFKEDDLGRLHTHGRNQARDIFDLYMLSKKICPLHIFLREQSRQVKRGIIHWYRTFSRQDVSLALLDLDMYDVKFDAKKMIIYLEDEIKKTIKEELE